MVITLDKVKLIAIRVIERSKTVDSLIKNLNGQANWVKANKNIIDIEVKTYK